MPINESPGLYSHGKKALLKIFDTLFEAFGSQHWWPADTPFEIMVGAVLTQNTAWANVNKAIENLKRSNCLTPKKILSLPLDQLATFIHPSGYYNQKAQKLKNLCLFLKDQYDCDLDWMAREETDVLRKKLLKIKGIGPETGDSILLYAFLRPLFVVDSYTHRILSRHQIIPEESTYDEIQEFFMDFLEPDVQLFQEFHALIVTTGKNYCRKKPRCSGCPLESFSP